MKSKQKISFITTVYNEAHTIEVFLTSLMNQTQMPEEIIIVDGGSKDNTVKKIKDLRFEIKDYKGMFKLIVKRGNRSVGRNEAIRHTTGQIIVCSDSGNILDKNWIKNITQPFMTKNVDVVAGYYKNHAKTLFQKCVVPYALVMEDKIDPANFLPATRSIAFKKSIWGKIGGFDEKLSHNEDYVFAKKLEKVGAKIIFEKTAIVYWIPRKTLKQAFVMMFRFALGDAEAKIARPKVLLLFARYIFAFYWLFLCLLYKSIPGFELFVLAFLVYIIWAIRKNYRYVKQRLAILILPLLQFTADIAVMSGTFGGLIYLAKSFNYSKFVLRNKFLFFMLIIYVGYLVLNIKHGIPNQYHPFPYNMDEWHQFQAVRASAKFGTPNIPGAANGTMFQFLLTVFYLAPFTLLHIINPVVLKLNNFVMRERIFEFLRINTIFWGVLSIFVLNKIAELVKAPRKLTLYLFTITPIWLLLSGYFKYDIALQFWIVLFVFFILKFAKEPTGKNFVIAAIPAGLAFAVKVSAIPLLPIYLFSYFWFWTNWKKHIRFLLMGFAAFIITAIFFGLPDTLFGRGNLVHYFYENVVTGPITSAGYQLGMSSYAYVYLRNYPLIFGHGLIVLFFLITIFLIYLLYTMGITKFIKRYKVLVFLIISFVIFLLSLLPLQFYAVGYRSLVLLPFIVLVSTLTYKELLTFPKLKTGVVIITIFVICVQLFESFAWVYMVLNKNPQEVSSNWITKNIPKDSKIGLENIPIYQNIPDILQKEFYYKQYQIPGNYHFMYQIVDATSKKLPKYIVITDDDADSQTSIQSAKKSLVIKIKNEKYNKIVVFSPDFTYFKLFGNDIDYYFSYIVSSPLTITVYKK